MKDGASMEDEYIASMEDIAGMEDLKERNILQDRYMWQVWNIL
jgi:hypothetical protein